MPKFSVIVPVYNVEKYVRQCIESVLNQSFKDFEVIVIDDCGNDNSMQIVEEYKNDKRIKIVRHNKNLGLAAARNSGLKNAKGKYIVCLDSDDWMELNCLEVINAMFNNCKTESIWFNTRKYFENTHSFAKQPMYNQNEGYRTLTPDNIAAFADFTWIKAYTRESIQKYNLGWPVGLTFEDGEFYFKYFTHNPVTYVINDCLINYRHRDDSIVRNADRGNVKMEDIYEVLRHLKTFWEELGVYNKYKSTMLKLLQNRLRMCYGLNYSDEYKKMSYELLNDFKYPEDFEQFNPEYKRNHQNPLVTVVVPFYNVEKYIQNCLESIINQTYKNIEIICVDDESKDSSYDIVKNIAENNNKIKIIRHKKNKGLGGARNTGVKNAKGEYVFFVDSDDWLDKFCIEKTVEKFLMHNLNTIWFKAKIWWEENHELTNMWIFSYYDKYPEGKLTLDNKNLINFPLYTWNKAYNTEFLRENGLYWQENMYFEDVEFYFKTFIKSPDIYIIDEPLYYYRRRNDSIIAKSTRNEKIASDLYKAAQNVHKYLLENDLFDMYKDTFLQYVYDTVNMYKEYPEFHKKIYKMMLDYINSLNI